MSAGIEPVKETNGDFILSEKTTYIIEEAIPLKKERKGGPPT